MRLLLLISCIVLSCQLWSQQTKDSLLQVWENPQKPAVERLQAVDQLIREHFQKKSPDSAYQMAVLEYQLAKENKSLQYEASAKHLQGKTLFLMGKHTLALEALIESNKIHQELNDQKGIAENWHLIGGIYFEQKDIENANLENDNLL